MATFTVLFNGEKLKTYELDEPVITIGRLPENTISIANMGVSRRHVRIEEDADRKYIVIDLNSLNGTYVNGKKIKKVELIDGDKISIGKYVIIYKKKSAESISAPEDVPVQSSHSKETSAQIKSVTEEVRVVESSPAPSEEQPGSESHGAGGAVLIETNKHVVYKLDKPYITIGNGENDDVFVAGFMIGKGQVCVEHRDDGLYITAQKLMGKLKVNGRTTRSHLLKHKDRIELGSSTFRFMENG